VWESHFLISTPNIVLNYILNLMKSSFLNGLSLAATFSYSKLLNSFHYIFYYLDINLAFTFRSKIHYKSILGCYMYDIYVEIHTTLQTHSPESTVFTLMLNVFFQIHLVVGR
jgi:hypothetical protein